jgi:phage gp36-like protein
VAYITLDQLIERFGERTLLQLADRSTPPAGTIDTAIVDRAVGDTSAQIDGYLAGRYLLPLDSTPPLLVDLAAAIAIYKLHIFTPNQKITNDYKDAIKALTQISTGVIRLPVAGIEPAASGATGVETTDRPRDFTPENLRGFI